MHAFPIAITALYAGVLGIILVLIHYWGITARKDPGRGIGATITWLVLVVSGLIVLYQHWGA